MNLYDFTGLLQDRNSIPNALELPQCWTKPSTYSFKWCITVKHLYSMGCCNTILHLVWWGQVQAINNYEPIKAFHTSPSWASYGVSLESIYDNIGCVIKRFNCLQVCLRQDQAMSWVLEVLQGVMVVMDSPQDRLTLLYNIVDVFKEYALDLHEYGDAGEFLCVRCCKIVNILQLHFKRIEHDIQRFWAVK